MKTILSLFLAGIIAWAGSVDFKEADPDSLKRVHPSDRAILSYADMLDDVKRSVVNISIEKSVKSRMAGGFNPFFNDPFFRQFFDDRYFNIPKERVERSLGSGVVISADGYIVTNNHVVAGADKVIVTLPGDKKEYEARIVGTDPKSDLAVVKIDGKGFRPVTFYDSDNVRVGDVVFALGNPFGVGETITKGIVSATKRSSVGIVEYEDFIQTDASINPGNSGGALVNSLGQLVGVNSAIISKSGGNVGIGFAIPSNMVKNIAKALIENGKFTRAYLGVTISDVTEELAQFYDRKEGAVVMSVEPDSAADAAGLLRGDLIVRVGGQQIDDATDLKNTIASMPPEKETEIEYIRDKKAKSAKVMLKSRDGAVQNGDAIHYKGLGVSELTQERRRTYNVGSDILGMVVTVVEADSPAMESGFEEGDVVVQVEQMETPTSTAFKHAVQGKEKKRFFVYRRGMIFALVL